MMVECLKIQKNKKMKTVIPVPYSVQYRTVCVFENFYFGTGK